MADILRFSDEENVCSGAQRFWMADALEVVTTSNAGMQAVFDKVRSVALARTPVLLSGETGTGKGLLAKLIHMHSLCRGKQFVGVHCGAIPDALLESELYGHEKGAFTGAVKRRRGKFELAGEGTLFLDEIGTISGAAQIKLLQVLQDGTYSRVGGEEMLTTRARVISATNADLRQMTDAGQFRRDLYYRLHIFPIEIPPLRERKEDLAGLVGHFLKKLNADHGKRISHVHSDVMAAFQQYAWPGNIRELENLLERAYILEKSHVLTPAGFPPELFARSQCQKNVTYLGCDSLAQARRRAVEAFERDYLDNLLRCNRGRIDRAAAQAVISSRQLNKLLNKHGIRKETYKGHARTPCMRPVGQ